MWFLTVITESPFPSVSVSEVVLVVVCFSFAVYTMYLQCMWNIGISDIFYIKVGDTNGPGTAYPTGAPGFTLLQ
jgi:hypothetical protein